MPRYKIQRKKIYCTSREISNILRGAAIGFILACCLNYHQFEYSDRRGNEEPDIPENFLKNLSSPIPPVSGEYHFVLRPTKVISYLKKNPRNRCYITLMVQGAESAKRRFLTRLSWAPIREIDGKRICVFFVLASNINKGLEYLLDTENQLYGDILQSNLPRSPINFSSQIVLSAFQWVVENMDNRSDYYITIRSDVLPDVPNIYEYCLKMDKSDKKEFFHCGLQLSPALPKPTIPSADDYVSVKEYPNLVYPAYCSPEMVIQSNELVHNLYETARFTYAGKIPNEGVYVWGVLREKMRREGKKNLISAGNFLQSEENFPLAYKMDLSTTSGQKDMKMKSDQVRQRLMFDESDNQSEQDPSVFNRRKAVLEKLPTTNSKITPEIDMRSFVSKWNALSRMQF